MPALLFISIHKIPTSASSICTHNFTFVLCKSVLEDSRLAHSTEKNYGNDCNSGIYKVAKTTKNIFLSSKSQTEYACF